MSQDTLKRILVTRCNSCRSKVSGDDERHLALKVIRHLCNCFSFNRARGSVHRDEAIVRVLTAAGLPLPKDLVDAVAKMRAKPLMGGQEVPAP